MCAFVCSRVMGCMSVRLYYIALEQTVLKQCEINKLGWRKPKKQENSSQESAALLNAEVLRLRP